MKVETPSIQAVALVSAGSVLHIVNFTSLQYIWLHGLGMRGSRHGLWALVASLDRCRHLFAQETSDAIGEGIALP
jgi:hypothetical protein